MATASSSNPTTNTWMGLAGILRGLDVTRLHCGALVGCCRAHCSQPCCRAKVETPILPHSVLSPPPFPPNKPFRVLVAGCMQVRLSCFFNGLLEGRDERHTSHRTEHGALSWAVCATLSRPQQFLLSTSMHRCILKVLTSFTRSHTFHQQYTIRGFSAPANTATLDF